MILTGGCLFRLFYEEKEKDKIGIVSLNRPDKMNALSEGLLNELTHLLNTSVRL